MMTEYYLDSKLAPKKRLNTHFLKTFLLLSIKFTGLLHVLRGDEIILRQQLSQIPTNASNSETYLCNLNAIEAKLLCKFREANRNSISLKQYKKDYMLAINEIILKDLITLNITELNRLKRTT